jgi:hypothetical protein
MRHPTLLHAVFPLLLLAITACATLPTHGSRRCNVALDLPASIPEARRHVVLVRTDKGLGTGFVLADDRDTSLRIVTNHHVIAAARAIEVELPGVASEPVTLARVTVEHDDPARDLAVLRVPKLAGVELGLDVAHGAPVIGQAVFVLGYPYVSGSEPELTAERGEITNPSRRLGAETYIQTNANINPGNSGGPVLDACGQLVGVVVARSNSTDRTALIIPVEQLHATMTSAAEPRTKQAAATPRAVLESFVAAIDDQNDALVVAHLSRAMLTDVARVFDETVATTTRKLEEIITLLERRGINFAKLTPEAMNRVLQGEIEPFDLQVLQLATRARKGEITKPAALMAFASVLVGAVLPPSDTTSVGEVQLMNEQTARALLDRGGRPFVVHLVREEGTWRVTAIAPRS